MHRIKKVMVKYFGNDLVCFNYMAIVALGLLVSPVSFGQSFLSVSVGVDEHSSHSEAVTYQYYDASSTKAVLYGSKSDDTVSGSDLSSSTWGGEFSLSANDTVDLGVGFERWGNSGDFTIQTTNLVLGISAEQWQISIKPRIQNVKVITGRTGALFEKLERGIDSRGITIRMAYEATERMSYSLFYSKSSYDWDFSNFDLNARPQLAQVFSPVTINLSQGLEDYSYGVDLSYYFDRVLVGADWIQSRSVVTSGKTDTLVGYGSFEINDDWNVGADIGAQTSSGSNTSFASINLGYSW